MIRTIITIDPEKCNGCGKCAQACHEGAIGIIDGKARLLRDDYCDGLGNCLPACPTGAITFEEREAAAFDGEAVRAHIAAETETPACGCPGSAAKAIKPHEKKAAPAVSAGDTSQSTTPVQAASELRQWPVQIKLVPVNAPYFENAHLLVAADCAAFACGDFHGRFMKNKITVIGCPKLDGVDYSEKLTGIIAGNTIKSVTVVRMEVPCCGIEQAVITALKNSGKFLPWRVITLTTDGEILED